MAENEPTLCRFGRLAGLSRPGLPRLFGWREEGASGQDAGQDAGQLGVLESPKPPEINTREGRSPLNRFALPNMSHIWPGRLLGRESHADADLAGAPRPVSPDRETWEVPLPPEPATHARSTIRAASSCYSTNEESGSAETNPSSQEREERRRRRQRRRRRRRQHEAMWYGGRRTRGRKTPKRFLYCFPWVKSRQMRAYILRCLVSGFFLVALLTICKSINGGFEVVSEADSRTRPGTIRQRHDQRGRLYHRVGPCRHPGHTVLLVRACQAMPLRHTKGSR